MELLLADHRVAGCLLNLSEDGLACLVDASESDALAAAGQVCCRLGLSGTAARLTLVARVVYVAAAAREGQVRVGLEFTREARNADARRGVSFALRPGNRERS